MMKVLSMFGACTNATQMDAPPVNVFKQDLNEEPSSRLGRLVFMKTSVKNDEVRLDLPAFFEPKPKPVARKVEKPKRQRPQLTVVIPRSRQTKITDQPRPVPMSFPFPARDLHFPRKRARRYRCKRCKRIFHQEMNARAHFFCSRRSGNNGQHGA